MQARQVAHVAGCSKIKRPAPSFGRWVFCAFVGRAFQHFFEFAKGSGLTRLRNSGHRLMQARQVAHVTGCSKKKCPAPSFGRRVFCALVGQRVSAFLSSQKVPD